MARIGESIEVKGRSTQEAIDLALSKLGVSKEKVKIRVLSEERKGLFGMEGAKQARVKVTVVK